MPQWRPTANPPNVATPPSAFSQKYSPPSPSAISIVQFSVPTACVTRPRQRIWTTGIAGFHLVPNMAGTRSGAITIKPMKAGAMKSDEIRLPRSHADLSRSRSDFNLESAGNATCEIGAATMDMGIDIRL